jgi:hypothetical protein
MTSVAASPSRVPSTVPSTVPDLGWPTGDGVPSPGLGWPSTGGETLPPTTLEAEDDA